MSRPVVALCRWEYWNSLAEGFMPVGPNEPPTACRATLGDARVNVWLPRGARIVRRLSRFGTDPMRDSWRYVYGSHERGTRTLIRITLTEYPTNG